MTFLLSLGLLLAFSRTISSCIHIVLNSQIYGSITFTQFPIDAPESSILPLTGRPLYYAPRENNRNLYLYHRYDNATGWGQWIVNDEIANNDRALAFIESWAVLPTMALAIQDNPHRKGWKVYNKDWTFDTSFEVICAPEEVDNTLYFESTRPSALRTVGYYLERTVSAQNTYQGRLFSHIRLDLLHNSPLYLYEHVQANGDHVWLIGEQYGIDSAQAHVKDPSFVPSQLANPWNTLNTQNNRWEADYSASMWGIENLLAFTTQSLPSIHAYILSLHSLTTPTHQMHQFLRNAIPIPKVGLGTGGIPSVQANGVFHRALNAHYQLFDLAREYQNEEIMGSVLTQRHNIRRKQVFLQSKVWPTELGFHETIAAMKQSLQALQTFYLDQYMLHWPECNHQIDWMHCEDIVNPSGTWQHSYRALEKAYAEGYVQSIGVSNFDFPLLQSLETSTATILPHIVQNWGDLTHWDMDVRAWCELREVIYQPYAINRNIPSYPSSLLYRLQALANKYRVSIYTINNLAFLQTQAVIIPRSTVAEHLQDNLMIPSWRLTSEELALLGWKP